MAGALFCARARRVHAKSFDGAAQIGNINRNGFSGMMGGLTGGGQTAAEAPSVLTALVADYQITIPGKPVRHVKRFIFDSIGPDARRSAQPLPRPKWTEQQLVDRGADLASLNDTLVALRGTIYGKPVDERMARATLAKMRSN